MKKITLLFVILFAINFSFAQTIFVNVANPTNGDGTSWLSAFNNLQDAINQATVANEIWVAKGTYFPTKDTTGNDPTDNRQQTFFINKNIKLYGGFLGTETMLSAANPVNNATILSGDIGVVNDSTDNALHVIYFTSTTNNIENSCLLNGITITKGYASLQFVTGQSVHSGGGILFNSIGNTKTMNPQITNCIFLRNNARTGGACYFNINGNTVAPVFTNCVFKNNNAVGVTPLTPGGAGGAIRFDIRGIVAASFQKCTFESNNAGSGGTIYNICYSGSSSLSIDNCYFIKNSASSGGVIYSCSNGATVVNNPVFTNSAFVENSATSVGGAIYNIANQGETSSEAINCIFTKNISPSGAAMYSRQTAVGISNPTIKNSILWNLTTPNNEVVNNPTALSASTLINCIYSDGVIDMVINNPAGSGNIFINCIEKDPLFLNTNNLQGSDGLLRTFDDGLNVQNTSPVINAGSNSNLPNSITDLKYAKIASNLVITKDITGITNRIMEGVVDIGAFEFVAAIPLPVKLIEFSAELSKFGVQLDWQTTQEINVQSFEIERSIDAKKFENIGNVFAKNNSENHNYSFFDNQNIFGNEQLYYRLKVSDIDQSFQYSKIINVNIKAKEIYYLYPNPAKETLIVAKMEGANYQFKAAEIFNIEGKSIKNITFRPNGVDISQIAAGVYFLKLDNGILLRFLKE